MLGKVVKALPGSTVAEVLANVALAHEPLAEAASRTLLEELVSFPGELLAVGVKRKSVEEPKVLLDGNHLKDESSDSGSAASSRGF